MTFTQEQQKEAYKKLSPEVQDFVMSNETTELIDNLLKKSGLSEEQSVLADSEILYTLFNLQTLAIAVENIAKLSNKNIDDLFKLKADLENNIFNNIPQSTKRAEEEPEEPQTQNNIGNDFEQIILNQARAMQPAQAPNNLPTSEQNQGEPPKAIHNYISESDPYREPLA